MVLGALAGLGAQQLFPKLADGSKNPTLDWLVTNITTPGGQIFLTMIFMIVVPLLFSALVLGVAEIGESTKIGRVGLRSLAMTCLLSGIAVALALVAVNLVKPGEGIGQQQREAMMQKVDKEAAEKRGTPPSSPSDAPVLGIIPPNPLLEATRALSGGIMPFMFFALIFGIALSAVEAEKALPVKAFLEGLFAVSLKIIEYAMLLAPLGVFCLVFQTGALLGVEAFIALGKYAALVLAVLAIHLFGTYSLVIWLIAKKSPAWFFRQMKTVMLTAFTTSSSNATLPTALKAAEEDLGLPGDISRFVLTVGATANQNGTALFEGITIIFICQLFQVDLSFQAQLWVMFMAIIAGVGTAGVPGGAWPMIGTIVAQLGAPLSSIGLVLGIDRILDMSRTVLNVTGDMTIALCVTAWEGRSGEAPLTPPEP